MVYLLKITIAWSLFLLLFEALYKNNGKFTANRIYLLLSMAAGLLLPLMQLPHNAPAIVRATQNLYPTEIIPVQHTATNATANVSAATVAGIENHGIDLWQIAGIIYIIGVGLLLGKCLLEFIKMLHIIRRGERMIINGRKVIATGNIHAPYSFMGWIFIGDPAVYTAPELAYIIRHEAAHNLRQHWLDLLLLQLTCILLWFHPLTWRFRHLLKFQHEYEADHLAANNDVYGYGHFLLQLTLLDGVPSIAHSFHFSPIKNRIKMLTKRQNQKNFAWKYLVIIPALFGCTFLMAKSTGKSGNSKVTAYNGSTIMWRETDTFYYDKQKKVVTLTPAHVTQKRQIIFSMNNEPVYQNEYLKTPATFGNDDMAYAEYLQKEFKAACKNTADSVTGMSVYNIVIDKQGKIIHYNVQFFKPYTETEEKQSKWDPFYNQSRNIIADKIIKNGADWKPAKINGQPVLSVISLGGGGC